MEMEPESSKPETSVPTNDNGDPDPEETVAPDPSDGSDSKSQGRFECHKCPERFTTKAERSTHFLSAHQADQEQFKCDLCTEIFSKERTLERHMLMHLHPTCKVCGYRLESPEAMTEHMKIHERTSRVSTKKATENRKDSETCDDDPETTEVSAEANATELKTLIVREDTRAWSFVRGAVSEPNGEYICSICRATGFNKRLHLEIHLRRHFKEYIYACCGCDHQFVSLSAANSHLKKKSCSATSSSTYSPARAATVSVKSSVSVAPVQVPTATAPSARPLLQREATRAWALSRKAERVDAVRKFICPVCNVEGINDRSNLEVHIRRHFKECICACPKCDRTFMCHSDLTVHSKVCTRKTSIKNDSFQDAVDEIGPADDLDHGTTEEVQVSRGEPTSTRNSRHRPEQQQDEGSGSNLELGEDVSESEHSESENIERSYSLRLKGFTTADKREETQSYIVSMNAEPCQTNPVRFQCTFCGQNTFINRRNLEGHLRSLHFKEHLFSCNICGKRVMDGTAVKRHKCKGAGTYEREEDPSDAAGIEIETPTQFEPFQRKKSQAYLKSMKTRQDPAAGNLFPCSLCKKKAFRTRIMLEMHMRVHFSEYACECHKCRRKFYTTTLLKKHLGNCGKSSPSKNSGNIPTRTISSTVAALNDHKSETFRNVHSFKSTDDPPAIQDRDGSIRFKCQHCPKTFGQRIALKFHERQHVGTLHECSDCGKGYTIKSNLLRHRRDSCPKSNSHSQTKISPNKISSSLFARSLHRKTFQNGAKRHIRRSVTIRNSPTVLRGATNISLKKVQQKDSKCTKNVFPCKYCGTKFQSEIIRDGHEAIHLGKAPKCPDCGKMFKNLITLRRHRRYFPCQPLQSRTPLQPVPRIAVDECKTEEASDTFECDFCRKLLPSSIRSSHLSLHKRKGDKLLCKFCPRKFNHLQSLLYHGKTHAEVRETHPCKDCGKVFYAPSSLRRHHRENLCRPSGQPQPDSLPEEEEEEDEMQISIENVWSESANVTGEPNPSVPSHSDNPRAGNVRTADGKYKCSYCSKVYTTSWMKKYHENTHKGVKPYKCESCLKCFHSAIRRQVHRHTVHGLRGPVTAIGCNPPGYMVRHSLIRSRERSQRPYKCRVCDARFFHRPNARRHMKNIHQLDASSAAWEEALEIQDPPANTHSCEQCGNVFQNTTLLERHIQAVHVEQRPFECQFCHLAFLSEEIFTKHVQNRLCSVDKIRPESVKASKSTYNPPADALHECCYCAKLFSNSSNLKGHERLHTGVFPYVCHVCSRGYNDRRDLLDHLKRIHDIKLTADQVQPNRSAVASRRNFLTRSKPGSKHFKMKPGQLRYACDHCEMTFFDKTELASHTDRQRQICKFCKKEFCSEEDLQQHREDQPCRKAATAGIDGLFKCDYCDEKFNTSHRKNYHENRHKGLKPYKCDACSARFYSPTGRQHHRHTVHSLTGAVKDPKCNPNDYRSGSKSTMYEKVGEEYRCRICKKRFPRSGGVIVHLRLHTGEKPYKCRECDAAFRQTHHAKHHMLKYHNLVASAVCERRSLNRTKPTGLPAVASIAPRAPLDFPVAVQTSTGVLKCSYCSLTFRTSYQKKYHENRHKNIKPYKCDACDRKFFSPSLRSYHRVSVHGLRGEVTAPGCNPEGYRNAANMNQYHTRVNGLYPCHFCEKTFAHRGGIVTHERLHTGEKPYRCRVCDARFTQSTHCTRHMIRHHRLKATPISDLPGNQRQKQQQVETSPSSTVDPLLAMLQPVVEIEEVHRCEQCEDEFNQQEILDRHVQVVHVEQRPFHCKTCQRGFFSEANYEKHVNNRLCDGNYRAVIQRSEHSAVLKKTKDLSELFECCFCSRQFSSKSNLATHEQRHTGQVLFTCETCSQPFFAKSDYQAHLMYKHGIRHQDDENQSQAAASTSPFKTGGRTRGIGIEYPCSRCDKAFCDASILAAHVQNVHIEQRPFHCEVCQRGFFSEAAHKRHVDHQLCRRNAELELAAAADVKEENAGEDLDEGQSPEIQRDLTLRLQISKYPWISQVQNGPYCYECVECNTKFTREIIAEAHRQWHRERNSIRSD